MKVLAKVFIGIITLTLIFFLIAWSCSLAFPLPFFDWQAPECSLEPLAKGIGFKELPVKVSLRDRGNGIDTFTIVAQEGDATIQVIEKKLSSPVNNYEQILSLKIPKKLLSKNEISLTLTASDSNFFANSASVTHSLPVDIRKPQASVLSTHHNGRVGGSLLILYSSNEKDLARHGIQVQHRFYHGAPLANIMSPESTPPAPAEFFYTLFPLPLQSDVSEDELKLVLEDNVGNITSINFYSSIKPERTKEAQLTLSKKFFVNSVNKLYNDYLQEKGNPPEEFDASSLTDKRLIEKFKGINEDYRRILQEKITTVIQENRVAEKLWEGVFINPMPSKPTSSYGERRTYYLGDYEAGGSRHDGIDLADTAAATVKASNKGKVIFADSLGIYGNALIIDHGMDIISLYGHLSSSNVNVGDIVEKGQTIGRSGSTGLAGGDHLHFEVRVHNEPTTPFEWLDKNWVRTRIEQPITDILSETTEE